MKRILFAVGMATVCLTSCGVREGVHKEYDFSPLDSIVTSWMDLDYYPGGAIRVVKDDSVVFEKFYNDFTYDTPVFVASAGKWVAAATIATVVDRTDLDWDDPVEKWVPEFKGDPKGGIQLRRLLSHTSGIRPYLPEPDVDNFNSLDSAMVAILPLDTVFTAGKRFEYGGLAMQVAGRMAEIAAGKDFETIFEENIAQPLGMKNSGFVPINRDGGHAPMLGGGLHTTLNDMMSFLSMISHNGEFNGMQIIKPATVAEMQKDQTGGADIPSDNYVQTALGGIHQGIYGFGEWRELIDENTREAYQISSPGWAGAYPWINKRDNVYGFFIAHVKGSSNKGNFSSFYGSPIISETVSKIVSE